MKFDCVLYTLQTQWTLHEGNDKTNISHSCVFTQSLFSFWYNWFMTQTKDKDDDDNNNSNKELTLSAKALMTSFAALHLAASSFAISQLSSIFCWHSCILLSLRSHCSWSLLAYTKIWNGFTSKQQQYKWIFTKQMSREGLIYNQRI